MKKYGFVEWFRPGEFERVERTLPALQAPGRDRGCVRICHGPNSLSLAGRNGTTG
jgi:hypothetical protein